MQGVLAVRLAVGLVRDLPEGIRWRVAGTDTEVHTPVGIYPCTVCMHPNMQHASVCSHYTHTYPHMHTHMHLCAYNTHIHTCAQTHTPMCTQNTYRHLYAHHTYTCTHNTHTTVHTPPTCTYNMYLCAYNTYTHTNTCTWVHKLPTNPCAYITHTHLYAYNVHMSTHTHTCVHTHMCTQHPHTRALSPQSCSPTPLPEASIIFSPCIFITEASRQTFP